MSLRESISRNVYLHGIKKLVNPMWVWINGRTGQDRWLAMMRECATQPISVIFDVGSSGGYFLGKAAPHFARARYHHFEPRPEAAAALKDAIARLGTDSEVHPMALADVPGKTKFAVMEHGDASSLLVTTRGVGSKIVREIEVNLQTLDDVVARNQVARIGLLKIDVEGAEKRVLVGGLRTLSDLTTSVILEISPPRHEGGSRETLEVFRLMFDAGFALVDTFHCDYLFTKDPGILAHFSS